MGDKTLNTLPVLVLRGDKTPLANDMFGPPGVRADRSIDELTSRFAIGRIGESTSSERVGVATYGRLAISPNEKKTPKVTYLLSRVTKHPRLL